MRESGKYNFTSSNIATHLTLISTVHGLEQTENFYRDIPNFRIRLDVYAALLTCYAKHKSLEKAEALMKEIKKIYPVVSPRCYNTMLKLYAEFGKYDKLNSLMRKMMEKDVRDHATYTIMFNACVAAEDIEGMDKLLMRMEVDPFTTVRWYTYTTAANGYLKGGNVEKALSALKKSERLAVGGSHACRSILPIYAAIGNKDEVYRIWNKWRPGNRFLNHDYFLMLSSLVKLGDIVGAEKILEKWESKYKDLDTRIPDLMIGTYYKLGMLDKAEACIRRLLEKAVQAMKNVLSAERITLYRPKHFSDLASSSEYLKGKEDLESVLQILKFYSDGGYLFVATYDELVSYVHGEIPDSIAIDLSEGKVELTEPMVMIENVQKACNNHVFDQVFPPLDTTAATGLEGIAHPSSDAIASIKKIESFYQFENRLKKNYI